MLVDFNRMTSQSVGHANLTNTIALRLEDS